MAARTPSGSQHKQQSSGMPPKNKRKVTQQRSPGSGLFASAKRQQPSTDTNSVRRSLVLESTAPVVAQVTGTQALTRRYQQVVKSEERLKRRVALLSTQNEALVAEVVVHKHSVKSLKLERRTLLKCNHRLRQAATGGRKFKLYKQIRSSAVSRPRKFRVLALSENKGGALRSQTSRAYQSVRDLLTRAFPSLDEARKYLEVFLLHKDERKFLDHLVKTSGLKEKIIRGAVQQIEAYWSTARGCSIMSRCNLSRASYAVLMQGLCFFANDDNELQPKQFEGTEINFPQLNTNASRYKLEQLQSKLFQELNPKQSGDGKQCEVSILSLVDRCLTSPPSYLEECRDFKVMLSGDAAGMFRNLSHVNMTFALQPHGVSSAVLQQLWDSVWYKDRKVSECYTVITYEGKDKHVDVNAAIDTHLVPELNILAQEGRTVDGKLYNFIMQLGGDLSFINSVGALAGCSCNTPCPWCTTKRSDFKDPAKEGSARTVQDTVELAHLPHSDTTFPHQCRQCSAKFATREDMENEELPSAAAHTRHHQTHFGVRYHVRLLFEMVPIADRRLDSLHNKLRGVDMVWKKGISPLFADAEKVAFGLWWLKTRCGAAIKVKAKVKSKKAEKKDDVVPCFIGRESDRFMKHYPELLSELTEEGDDDRVHITAVMESMIAVQNLLVTRMLEDTLENRTQKAADCKRLGRAYVEACKNAFSGCEVLLYPHCVADHLPDQILAHGDPIYASMERQESIHSQSKKYLRLSNIKPGKGGRMWQRLQREVISNIVKQDGTLGAMKSLYKVGRAAKKAKAAAQKAAAE
jgi:hypothetical protein